MPAREAPGDSRNGEVLLSLHRVSLAFGHIQALDDVSLEVRRGEIVGLIGPNGSGKTTLLNVVSNLYRPQRGAVYFLGERLDGLAVHEVARRGIGRTFQVARVFGRLTALQNLLVPGYTHGEVAGTAPAQLRARAWELLRFFDLEGVAHVPAGQLSGGQQKLLEFARALMLQPRLLLLDEPFAGVHPLLKERMLQHIAELHAQGLDFVLVSHDLPTMLGVSSRLVVLANGQKIADGDPEAVRQEAAVVEAYLGV
ncbi:MAG: ABC transporter ATP-binding protein [Candidatus Tectimicrobiota bacterium]|nr:MAG: ABC transporter ATP-binding protein [Candidatus Tectomicrobia bacterium]